MLVRFFVLILAGFFLLQAVPAAAQAEPQGLRDQVNALSDRKYSESDVAEANRLLPIVQEHGNPELTFDLLDWLSDYYTDIGDYKQAMLYSRQAAIAARQSKDSLRMANGQMNIATNKAYPTPNEA